MSEIHQTQTLELLLYLLTAPRKALYQGFYVLHLQPRSSNGKEEEKGDQKGNNSKQSKYSEQLCLQNV